MTWQGENAHLLYPDTLAHVASGGFFQQYDHIVYLSTIIAPLIARGNARIIVEMPPRVGKSFFCTEWLPIWFLQNFDGNVMLAAYSGDLASDFGRKIRNHLQFNPHLPTRLSATSTAVDRFTTSRGFDVYAQGVGGAFTGRGCKLFIVDDPFKDWKEASSETRRRDIVNWWDSTADTRLEPNASVLIVNTRWHQGDLAGHCQAQGGWTVIRMPALCEDPLTDPLKRERGAALCPQRFDRNFYLAKKQRSAPMIWNALYQQRPTPPGGTIIQRDWLRYYKTLPPNFNRIIQSWDLSFKDTSKSDYVVGQVWGEFNHDYYLIYQVRERLSFTKTLAKMLLVSKMFPTAYKKLVEEKANGAAILDVLSTKLGGLEAIVPRESKEARLSSTAPLYQQGRVVYPDPETCSWDIRVHIEELVNFGGAPHDDTVDTATQALQVLNDSSSERIESLILW